MDNLIYDVDRVVMSGSPPVPIYHLSGKGELTKGMRYDVLIDLKNPLNRQAILPPNSSQQDIKEAINSLANNPILSDTRTVERKMPDGSVELETTTQLHNIKEVEKIKEEQKKSEEADL